MPLYEDDADLISVVNDRFSVGFREFEVHNYALVPKAATASSSGSEIVVQAEEAGEHDSEIK